MGLLTFVTDNLRRLFSDTSLLLTVAAGFFGLLVLAILSNVLLQLFVKNPNEPPIVFHWVPFIGSTVTYGIDPYKFFFAAREKV